MKKINLQEYVANFLNENFASSVDDESRKAIKRELEMADTSDAYPDGRDRVLNSEFIRIAEMFDVDIEVVMSIYNEMESEFYSSKDEELEDDVLYTASEYFNGEFPDSFSEFWNMFKTLHFDNVYSPKEVRAKFEKLSKDPNQLKLFSDEQMNTAFESLKRNKSLSKIIGEGYDWSSILSEAEYKGRKVNLNKPFRTPGGPKKFAVYVKDGDTVKIVRFGDPKMRVKNSSKKRASSFQKRHNCDSKKDRTTPGYWSCNIGRYAKSLGMSSSRKW